MSLGKSEHLICRTPWKLQVSIICQRASLQTLRIQGTRFSSLLKLKTNKTLWLNMDGTEANKSNVICGEQFPMSDLLMFGTSERNSWSGFR